VLFEQKRTDQAQTRLEQELALDPRCYGCMAKLAHIAYLNGDDGQSQSWLGKAAALDPDYVETNLVSGMLASRAGRYDEASHLPRASSAGLRKGPLTALAYQRSARQ
jgi:Tfp pilus assembly protein PilF